MPTTIHLDYETFSACDIGSCGAQRYARDPSTEILMIGLAVGDEEPVVWLPNDSRFSPEADRAEEILDMLADPSVLVYAHNALFEIGVTDALFERTTGRKAPSHSQWRCTAAMARRAALPASLAKCGEALNLRQQKDPKGAALIRKFSIPQKPNARSKKPVPPRIRPEDDPDEFALFIEYCRQDVRTEREIHKALGYFELTGAVLDTFQLDIAINTRGFPVNIDALHKAQAIVGEVTARVTSEFVQLTGGIQPTQNAVFLAWLKEQGYQKDNLQAATLDEEIQSADFDPESLAGRALLLKKQIAYAAVKKIPAMLACAGPDDNRVRGTLVFHGAGPGRWSGALVQPQNFKRPTIPDTKMAYRHICEGMDADSIELLHGAPLEVVASCIRHFIHDIDDGHETPMLSADYAAIEARIVCWLAGQEDALEEYRQGIDRYIRMASLIYGVPESKVNKHPQRFVGKQATLGCGYGMGPPKFRVTCENFGYKDLPEGLEFTAVEAFRAKHPEVVRFWRKCEKAAKAALSQPGFSFEAGEHVTFAARKISGIMYLFMHLPSGREIAYPHAKVEPQMRYTWHGTMVQTLNPTDEQIDKAVKRVGEGKVFHSQAVTYFGQLPDSVQWGRVSTYGGKLVENATQGTAADIMAHGALNAERAGYQTWTLIHDEFLGRKGPRQTAERLVKLMTDLPSWADGLPVEAEGGEVPYYQK